MKLQDIPGNHVIAADVAGQATAGTADEFVVGRVPFRSKVVAVYYSPKSAVTGAATNHFNLTVRNRVSGAGSAVVANRAYDNGVNAAAFDDNTLALSGTAANLDLAEGDILTAEKLVVGTGMAMPAGMVVVVIQAR